MMMVMTCYLLNNIPNKKGTKYISLTSLMLHLKTFLFCDI